eukprot:CCRYP_017376-RA/>CCRYP_017376-RA protein AED:0.35 eAED:0.35 QI:0/-1/0/1/-1/1/1/0/286
MTITQPTQDAEISFHPTAPPLPTAPTAPFDDYSTVATATATAIPIVSATAVPDTSTTLENSATPSSLLPGGTSIERITNSDGSLSVKVTKTTTQDDGYHHVRIEHYRVPADMASSVIQSMDINGMAPSSVYMTKIEDHRVPPGGNLDEALTGSSPAAHSTPGMPPGGGAGGGTTPINTMVMNDYERSRRRKCACFIVTMLVVLFWIIFAASFNSYRETVSGYSPPSPSYSYGDDFFNPSYPTPSYSYPMYLDDDQISSFTMTPSIRKIQSPMESPHPTLDSPSSTS